MTTRGDGEERDGRPSNRDALTGVLRSAMSAEEQLLAVLYHAERLSPDQIADVLGVASDEARDRLARMHLRLGFVLDAAASNGGSPTPAAGSTNRR